MDLNLPPLLLAVAKERKFRAAADRMGVTRSAVSQDIRRLKDTLGVALVVRTTRSVQLTDAGTQLVQSLEGPLVDISSALDATDTSDAPRGHLRLTATSIAEPFLLGPLLASFAERYPDVTVTGEEFDIVERGFDAGIRLGQVIEKDMIAVPLGGEQRERAAAARLRRKVRRARSRADALPLGVRGRRLPVRRRGRAATDDERFAPDAASCAGGRRHHVRARGLPARTFRRRLARAAAGGIPATVFRLLSLLSAAAQHGAEAACVDRLCAAMAGAVRCLRLTRAA
ncbi:MULTISPECIES: LysR family transcriptional regulator [Burkholderia]|nr:MULTISPECIES: LysR family transcriptional regulator [Burkholderia]MDG0064592.1 LysR family transcriptional regulator [Burkholderia sp. IO2]MDN7542653.1 LysR family transcriptional regulator [Burkholderia cenocepacia]